MKKNILCCLTVLFVLLSVPVFAKDARVVDNAGILTPLQAQAIRERLDNISETYRFDLVLLIEESIGNTRPMVYADDYFDYHDYGYGDEYDGLIFLQVTDSRDYWFSSCGRGVKMINELALNELKNKVRAQLKNDNYYEAYLAFANAMEKILILDAQGRSFGIFQAYYRIFVLVSWIIGLLAALIVVSNWKYQMNTARLKSDAASCIVPGSLAFAVQSDRFLYSTTSRSARQTSSSGGGGGGSHTSSSGRSHGGGGGKY